MQLADPVRRSLAQPAGPVTGLGVRAGFDVSVRLLPAEPGQGLWLERTDLGLRLPLHLSHALDLPSCTAIGTCAEDATLFVEHLMATLHVAGLTDLTVQVSGPEVPLLDGSARMWHELLRQAGVVSFRDPIVPVEVTAPVRLGEQNDTAPWITAEPSTVPRFCYELRYDHPMIGRQEAEFTVSQASFGAELAAARTFAPAEELQQSIDAGILKGGSEENCLVIYADHYSAPPNLPDAFARHKIMDMLGDLYLLGRPVWGAISGHRTGHSHNRRLLRSLEAYDKV
jgi:UDP-3-O-[3-hydroxymyristoyl] N-acetylglucosamine deacetylase